MESWIRSRPLPVFFAVNYFGVLLAVPVVLVVSMLLHDRVLWHAVAEMIITPLVFAIGITVAEASRRRGERVAVAR